MNNGHRRSGRDVRALAVPYRQGRRNPLLAVLRWRREILLLAGLLVVQDVLTRLIGSAAAIAAVLGAVALVALVPATRRALLRFGVTLVTEHRLRVGFRLAGTASRVGRPPAVIWSRGHRFGTVATVWLPAGVTIDDIRADRQVIAVACFAETVEVDRHPRHAQLVNVTVLRHRPGATEETRQSFGGATCASSGSASAGAADAGASRYRGESVAGRRAANGSGGFLSGLARTFAPFGDHRQGVQQDVDNIARDFARARGAMESGGGDPRPR